MRTRESVTRKEAGGSAAGRLELMSKPRPKAQPVIDDGTASAGDGEFREAQDDPHRLAYAYLRFRRMSGAGWTLHFYRDEWWAWDGTRYRQLPVSELRADVTYVIKTEFDRVARRLAREATADEPTLEPEKSRRKSRRQPRSP